MYIYIYIYIYMYIYIVYCNVNWGTIGAPVVIDSNYRLIACGNHWGSSELSIAWGM